MEDIKNIVNKVIGAMSSGSGQAPGDVQEIFLKVVSAKEAKHAKISGMKDGRLYVHIDSPAWLYQFKLKRKKIFEGLKERMPGLKSIYFKIGKTR